MQMDSGSDADQWNSAAAARERGAFFYSLQTRAERGTHDLPPTWGPPLGMHGMGGPPKPPPLQGLEEAWVLVFNAGKVDEDLCVDRTRPGRAPTLLAFECTHDADQFARLLQADGLALATPVRWDVRQLTAFSDHSGMQVSLVPRGELPPPDGPQSQDPESPHPTDDAYMAHRSRLEELLKRTPENCMDDDCIASMGGPLASCGPDADFARGLLREEAMAAIDAALSDTGTTDLWMLMQSACERVKADTSEGRDR